MTVYRTIQQFIHMLNTLEQTLDKAAAHADQKKFDSKVWMDTRLIADQFPFKKQIQVATDAAKGLGARLSGQQPPVFEDNEQTLPELKKRVQKTSDYLKTFKEDDFKNYETLKVPIGFMPGKYLTGKEYYEQLAVPNFFFHLTTAYSILRTNGVVIGKGDYLGALNFKDL